MDIFGQMEKYRFFFNQDAGQSESKAQIYSIHAIVYRVTGFGFIIYNCLFLQMDLSGNPLGSTYNFEHFEDEVSKESADLTVDDHSE